MVQTENSKQAEIMKQLYAMRQTGRFPTIETEDECLWMEVTQILRNIVLFSETPTRKAKILIFQNWDKGNLSYRMGNDDKSLVRQFSLQYNPNRIRDLEDRAIRNGYRTKYSPPDEHYSAGLLEIEVNLF